MNDNYSPASLRYEPDNIPNSPIQIHSDEEEHGRTPAHNLDLPIITPAQDIFASDMSDSDLDFDGE